MLIAALFVIAPIWKQPKQSTEDGYINCDQYLYIEILHNSDKEPATVIHSGVDKSHKENVGERSQWKSLW